MNTNNTTLRPISAPAFYHPAFETAHRFIIDDYRVPEKEICIFLPCSMKKPYSESPGHRVFSGVISSVLPEESYHIVVFGTCGVVPRELERMYPFAHYRFMLGKVKDPRVKRDFHRIETARIIAYLEKTRDLYKKRVAYCLGDFREAMEEAVQECGVQVTILPSKENIVANIREDLPFKQGSLHMQEYLDEFREELERLCSSWS